MTGLLTRHWRKAAAVLATAAPVILMSSLASAQGTRATEPAQLPPPTPLMPLQTDKEAPESKGNDSSNHGFPRIGAQQGDLPEGIEAAPLEEPEAAAIGTLDPETGGFGSEMWQGTERTVITKLFERLPDELASPTLRDMALRLLLARASPPSDGSNQAGDSTPSFLSTRVGQLAKLGEVSRLNALLRAIPRRHDDEGVARHRVEVGLLVGEADQACGIVRSDIALFHGQPFWQKALVFCQIVAGEIDEAMVGLGLLREQGGTDDPGFFALASAMTGLETELPEPLPPTPLNIAMLRTLDRPIPGDFVDRANPGTLAVLAMLPNAGLEQRTIAAENAVAAGALAPAALTQLYAMFEFTPEQLGQALSTAEASPGPRSRALLFQAMQPLESPAPRAEILHRALDLARRQGDDVYRATTAAVLPLLDAVQPRSDLGWFATSAARAFYAAGEFKPAAAWASIARDEALTNTEVAANLNALWPLVRLAGGDLRDWDGSLSNWASSQAQNAVGKSASVARQKFLRGCFQALGEPDPLAWNELAASEAGLSSPAIDASLIYAVRAASEAGRTGEAVLLSILLLGEHGPGDSHIVAVEEALSALTRVGQEPLARALAIEAAMANGV